MAFARNVKGAEVMSGNFFKSFQRSPVRSAPLRLVEPFGTADEAVKIAAGCSFDNSWNGMPLEGGNALGCEGDKCHHGGFFDEAESFVVMGLRKFEFLSKLLTSEFLPELLTSFG